MKPGQIDKETLFFKAPTFVIDALWMLGCLWYAVRYPWFPGSVSVVDNFDWIAYGSLLLFAWIIAVWTWDLRIANRTIHRTVIFARALGLTVTTLLVFFLLVAAVFKETPRNMIVQLFVCTWAGMSLLHVVINYGARYLRRHGRNKLRVLFVGNDHNNRSLMKDMREGFGVEDYVIHGVFTSLYQEKETPDVKVLGKIDEAVAYLGEDNDRGLDEIYCSLDPGIEEQQRIVHALVNYCNAHFIRFYFVPNMDGYPKRRMDYIKKGRVSVMQLHEEPLNHPLNKLVKRLMDIILSGAFLLLVYPWIYIFVFIGIKRSSPGPIYFRQARTGYNGKSFMIYKFRSMHVNVDADKVQATKDDPRKFAFGNFLRKSSIDELPQLINVFLGDMSIIGPRPHMEYHTEVYSNLISDYMVRHLVRPGLSGWAQVNGCRGETETVQQMKDRVDHDIWYIENWSLWLDIEIIFRTVWQVLGGDKQAY